MAERRVCGIKIPLDKFFGDCGCELRDGTMIIGWVDVVLLVLFFIDSFLIGFSNFNILINSNIAIVLVELFLVSLPRAAFFLLAYLNNFDRERVGRLWRIRIVGIIVECCIALSFFIFDVYGSYNIAYFIPTVLWQLFECWLTLVIYSYEQTL